MKAFCLIHTYNTLLLQEKLAQAEKQLTSCQMKVRGDANAIAGLLFLLYVVVIWTLEKEFCILCTENHLVGLKNPPPFLQHYLVFLIKDLNYINSTTNYLPLKKFAE